MVSCCPMEQPMQEKLQYFMSILPFNLGTLMGQSKKIRLLSNQNQKHYVDHFREKFKLEGKAKEFETKLLIVIEHELKELTYLIKPQEPVIHLQARIKTAINFEGSDASMLFVMPARQIISPSSLLRDIYDRHQQNGILFFSTLQMSIFGSL